MVFLIAPRLDQPSSLPIRQSSYSLWKTLGIACQCHVVDCFSGGQVRSTTIHTRQHHRILRSLPLRTCPVNTFPAWWIGRRGQSRPSRTLDPTSCELFCALGQRGSGAVQKKNTWRTAASNGDISAGVALSFVKESVQSVLQAAEVRQRAGICTEIRQ